MKVEMLSVIVLLFLLLLIQLLVLLMAKEQPDNLEFTPTQFQCNLCSDPTDSPYEVCTSVISVAKFGSVFRSLSKKVPTFDLD